MRRIAVLGSTGSIGRQTLDVISRNLDKFQVVSLVCNSNQPLLREQAETFQVEYAQCLTVEQDACVKAVSVAGVDVAVIAMRGIVSLEAVVYCLKHDIDLAIANKETLVCAGELIAMLSLTSRSRITPIDSEHNAIRQCLSGRSVKDVKRIYLTASGGPFREKSKQELQNVDYKMALLHPNWSMGSKITVDSATMFNKTLEVLEAKWLFGIDVDRIEILVHPQSIVHSMVEFVDGSVMAQLSVPDMRLPIQCALSNETLPQSVESLSLIGKKLEFLQPDFERFPCAKLAYTYSQPPLMPTVMNAANDVCVEKFAKNQILFCDFFHIITKTCEKMRQYVTQTEVTVDNIIKTDVMARQIAEQESVTRK